MVSRGCNSVVLSEEIINWQGMGMKNEADWNIGMKPLHAMPDGRTDGTLPCMADGSFAGAALRFFYWPAARTIHNTTLLQPRETIPEPEVNLEA